MILVTGATGFIGSAIVRALNEAGKSDLVLVDTVPPKQREQMLGRCQYKKFIPYDELLENLSAKELQNIECVIHMGAISSTTEKSWEKLLTHNVQLSQQLFQYCTQRSIPYIYASSGAVYGDGKLGFDDEIDPAQYKPLNLYGQSKRDFDVWALQQKQTPARWYGLRFFNVYGPNEYHKGDMASLVYKAYLQIKNTGRLKLFRSYNPQYKDGESVRDFVYVKDISRWILELVNNTKIPSGIYNQGFGESRMWLDLAKAAFENMSMPIHIDWIEIPSDIRDQYQYFTEAKMNKSFAAGFSKPKFSLESGVQDYIKHYLLTEQPYL